MSGLRNKETQVSGLSNWLTVVDCFSVVELRWSNLSKFIEHLLFSDPLPSRGGAERNKDLVPAQPLRV